MSIGAGPPDLQSIRRYVEKRILPLAPREEPIPFRGSLDASSEDLPFFDELGAALRLTPSAIWNITGPSGSGKTHLGLWAAAKWGRQFLADSERSPAPLWIPTRRLQTALKDDRSLTGGPFAFALALSGEVPEETPESLARLMTRREFILIVDKDEDFCSEPWTLKLPMGLPPGLRILHIAIRDSLGGHCVRLSPWDRETAILAAHRKRGAEGVKIIEALAASPASALASHAPFVMWLLDRADATPELASSSQCVESYLTELHGKLSGGIQGFAPWSEKLLLGTGENPSLRLAARRLHLEGSSTVNSVARIHHAYLLWKTLESGSSDKLLEKNRIGAEALSLLESLPFAPATLERLVWHETTSPVAKANLVNLHWKLRKTPLPKEIDLSGLQGLELAGHPFAGGLKKLTLGESNLSGITLGEPSIQKCDLWSCSFRDASWVGVHFHGCKLIECDFEMTDLSGAKLETCVIEQLRFTEAILSGVIFLDTTFVKVTFGQTGEGEPQRFGKCVLRNCDLSRLAASGLYFTDCKFGGTDFSGLTPPRFEANDSTFEKCDFMGFSAQDAKLENAAFDTCILADVSLEGADLRDARFVNVEFQPGPTSRAGHTDTLTRDDPMHGSKSGFYAQDLSEGVYLDPEMTRTADLRNCDLRGATFKGTDLFRVDLRGAHMHPELRNQARRMNAFVE